MVQHVRTKFKDVWAESGLQEDTVEEFVISVGGSDNGPPVE